MKKGLIMLLTGLSLLLIIPFAAGCSTKSVGKSVESESPGVPLSSKEINGIKGQLSAKIQGHYPDNYGLSRVYGEVVNGSKQDLKSITFAVSFGKQGKGTKVGEITVKNIQSGSKKSFDAATTANASTAGEYSTDLTDAAK